MTDDRKPDDDAAPVTVIGLGPMGQAMVRVLMAGGHPVTVWNRTPARADDLVAEGATRAVSPAEAVAAADLVILSLTDYQAMYDILGPAGDALAGKVIANLSSDTPDRTREASAWAAERGARLLAGGVMNPAPLVGAEGAYVYYSGPRKVFDAHEPTLRLIGEPRFVGEDPGRAQLYYQAQLDVFLTVLSALLHSTALVGSAGVTAAEFLPEAIQTVLDTPDMIGGVVEVARELDEGKHPGELSTVVMMGATADHIVGASESAGIDVALPRAVRSHYERAVAAGHGRDNWTSLFEVIRAG
jgi:3-hydroxyisobutyrate dehydrogenase-like beta-hydroxyacid dehydrogenase